MAISCKVTQMEPLTASVTAVTLMPSSPVAFQAGQYLQVLMGDKDKRPFSIANAPRADGLLELHIGAAKQNSYASEVVERMESLHEILIEAPLGKAYWREHMPQPTLLLAGGTGFSYIRAILQQILLQPMAAPVYLYWGTRQASDMYGYKHLMALAQEHPDLHFVPVVEEATAEWQGQQGWVHEAVLKDFDSLQAYQVYVAGSFEMAGVVREAFFQRGLQAENLFGDAYEFI